MFELANLNWLAVLVSTAAAFLLGGLYYGPLLGKTWMKAVGKKQEDLGGPAFPMLLSVVTSFATALLLALIMNAMGVATLVDGLRLGLYVGLCFIAAGMASDYAFCGWSLKLFTIQAGYRVLYSVLMGGILGAWR